MHKPDERSNRHELEELRRQNAELKAAMENKVAEQPYALMFEVSVFPTVFSTLANGIIRDANKAFEHEFGLSKKDVIGKTLLELGLFRNAEDERNTLEILKTNGSVRHPLSFMNSDLPPINRCLTVVNQVLVGLAEVAVAEKAAVGRQGGGVDGTQYQVSAGINERTLALGVGTPE